jgi:hypothetical protein
MTARKSVSLHVVCALDDGHRVGQKSFAAEPLQREGKRVEGGEVSIGCPIVLEPCLTPPSQSFGLSEETCVAGVELQELLCNRTIAVLQPRVLRTDFGSHRALRRRQGIEMLLRFITPAVGGSSRQKVAPRAGGRVAKEEALQHQRAIEEGFGEFGIEYERLIDCRESLFPSLR